MRRHVIFFIHGMGTHDRTWHESGLRVLSSAWGEYDGLNADGLEDKIEAIPIVYNEVFEEWRERMAKDFAGFKATFAPKQFMADEDRNRVKALSAKLDKIGHWIGASEPDFVWTHAADVILYRFVTTVRHAVDISVLQQIMNRIGQEDRPKTWSIIAHSLGTSVAHNALNSLYGSGIGNIQPLDPRLTRPRVLMMVSNVSRSLERPGAPVYSSHVKPGRSGERLCGYYLNIRHKYDPFTHVKPFDRDPWPDAVTFSSDRYQHIQPSHIQFNKADLRKIHELDHYLANPRVHVPLFKILEGKFCISEEEFKEAKVSFDADQMNDTVHQITLALEKKLPAPGGNWGMLIELFKKMA